MDIKEIKKLVAFMRKAGVSKLVDGSLSLELNPNIEPRPISRRKIKETQSVQEFVDETVETDGLTEQELLFYSAGGVPDDLKEG